MGSKSLTPGATRCLGAAPYQIRRGEPRVLYRSEDVSHRRKPTPVPHYWSPDGQYILVWFRKTRSPSEIGLVSVADGSVRVLKLGVNVYNISPSPLSYSMSISPDGQYIVYDWLTEEGPRQRDISLLAMDGSSDVPLIQHPAHDYGPVWTPDGNQIVFVSDRMGNPALWALQVVDGKPQGEPQLIRKNMNRAFPLGFTSDGSFYYVIATYTPGPGGYTHRHPRPSDRQSSDSA